MGCSNGKATLAQEPVIRKGKPGKVDDSVSNKADDIMGGEVSDIDAWSLDPDNRKGS